MFDWIKSLQMELDLVEESEILQITGGIRDGEEVIGDVPIPLRKLYSMMMGKLKKARLLEVEKSFATNPEKESSIDGELLRLTLETRMLGPLFWIEMHGIYGLWNKPLGLRKDYQVVIAQEIPNIFSELYKGDG